MKTCMGRSTDAGVMRCGGTEQTPDSEALPNATRLRFSQIHDYYTLPVQVYNGGMGAVRGLRVHELLIDCASICLWSEAAVSHVWLRPTALLQSPHNRYG